MTELSQIFSTAQKWELTLERGVCSEFEGGNPSRRWISLGAVPRETPNQGIGFVTMKKELTMKTQLVWGRYLYRRKKGLPKPNQENCCGAATNIGIRVGRGVGRGVSCRFLSASFVRRSMWHFTADRRHFKLIWSYLEAKALLCIQCSLSSVLSAQCFSYSTTHILRCIWNGTSWTFNLSRCSINIFTHIQIWPMGQVECSICSSDFLSTCPQNIT